MSLQLVLASGAAIRFLLPTVFPQITDVLASTVEISTPVDSFRSLQEAFNFLKNGMDVYDGGVVYHPPLLVAVMSYVNELPFAPIWFNLLFTVVDLGIAWKLININKWYNTRQSARSGKNYAGYSPNLICAFYLFNPLMILTNLSHSTSTFSNFLIVELVAQIVVDKNPHRGAIALAVAAYLSLTPAYLLVPILALSYAVAPERDLARQVVHGSCIFIASVCMLFLLSFALTALPDFVYQCYWTVLLFEKIAPNMGLWWYIFTEMFSFFTPLYKGIFNLYSFVFIVPITLRYFEPAADTRVGDSFLAVVMSCMWISFSKSYPIVGDLGLVFSMLPIFKNTVIPHTKFLFINALMLITCLVLAPIFYYCWIVLGNGNSNFFYSMSLIWGGVHILVFLDFLWGRLVHDYIQTHDVKDPSKLRLTQI